MFLTGYLKLGTLEELEERMSSAEYELWKELYYEVPFGAERRMLAILCSIVANANRGEHTEPFKIEDFLPQRPVRRAGRQPVNEQLAFADAVVAALGGKRGSGEST